MVKTARSPFVNMTNTPHSSKKVAMPPYIMGTCSGCETRIRIPWIGFKDTNQIRIRCPVCGMSLLIRKPQLVFLDGITPEKTSKALTLKRWLRFYWRVLRIRILYSKTFGDSWESAKYFAKHRCK